MFNQVLHNLTFNFLKYLNNNNTLYSLKPGSGIQIVC